MFCKRESTTYAQTKSMSTHKGRQTLGKFGSNHSEQSHDLVKCCYSLPSNCKSLFGPPHTLFVTHHDHDLSESCDEKLHFMFCHSRAMVCFHVCPGICFRYFTGLFCSRKIMKISDSVFDRVVVILFLECFRRIQKHGVCCQIKIEPTRTQAPVNPMNERKRHTK